MSASDKTKLDSLEGGLAYYKKLESNYTTVSVPVSTIPIGIESFNSTDMLLVDINGLALVGSVDYTISGTNIVLTTPITKAGQTVHFVALRAVKAQATDYSLLKGDPGDVSDVTLNGVSVVNIHGTAEFPELVEAETPLFDLSHYQISGDVDKDLYDAIVALGWENDVLIP